MSSKMGLKADPHATARESRRRGKAWAKSLVLVVKTRVERRRIMQALQRDVSFLAGQKVVGYSLVVGRRRMAGGEEDRAQQRARGWVPLSFAEGSRGDLDAVQNGTVGGGDSSSSSSFCLNLALEDVWTRHRSTYALEYAKKHKTTECFSPDGYKRTFTSRIERMVRTSEDHCGAGGGELFQTVDLANKVYTGNESVDELLEDADTLVKNDFPALAVLALRRARDAAAAAARGSSSETQGSQLGSVDLDQRAVAAKACEEELVALLEDMCDEHRWLLHGKGRQGATVSIEKKSGDDMASRLLRFKCELVMDVDIFSCIAVMMEVEDFPMWMPGVDQSDVRSSPTPFRKVVRVSGAKPWPFKRDELILIAYGALRAVTSAMS